MEETKTPAEAVKQEIFLDFDADQSNSIDLKFIFTHPKYGRCEFKASSMAPAMFEQLDGAHFQVGFVATNDSEISITQLDRLVIANPKIIMPFQ